MTSPGDGKHRGSGGNPMDILRQGGRSNRRNMMLILLVVVVALMAQQAGFFGPRHQGVPLGEAELASFERALERLPLVPTLGRGETRVVEFLDYQCGLCRGMAPAIFAAVDGGAPFELVAIELPQLGPESELAARFALAAALQDGYDAFHRLLMRSDVDYGAEALAELGAAQGLDAARLRADAEGDEVAAVLAANRALAASIGVEGTPSFVIGDMLVVGGLDEASFLDLVAAGRGE